MESRRDPDKKPPREEEKKREAGMDHTLEESFPASDPPSSIPNPSEADDAEETSERPDDERK